MWRRKDRQRESPGSRSGQGIPGEQAKTEPPDSPASQQQRITRLFKSGMHRTALDEILRGLRQDPDDFFLLKLGAAIAGGSRTEIVRATEPVTRAQRDSALLAPVATECSSCRRTWYSGHWALSGPVVRHDNPAGLQCQKCRYTLCRYCLDDGESPDPIDSPQTVMGSCQVPGHGLLGTPVLATGRSDVAAIPPDRIEAVIVTRDGPIPPSMGEALERVTRFIPLTVDDAALIHIRPSGRGLMASESGRDELALSRIHDLEREGVLAPGAWNRSERMCVKIPSGSDASYLLTVIRKENKNGPHPLYGLHAGMDKDFITALVGIPESHVGRGPADGRSPTSESGGSEHWMYDNTPPGIDTKLIIAQGSLATVEMKARNDGFPLLRVTKDGTYTPIVGYAAYALMLLLAQMPKLSDADIEGVSRQLKPKFPRASWQKIAVTDLLKTAVSVLEPWSNDPRHEKYLVARRTRGVLVVNDAGRICGFWETDGDRISVCHLTGNP